LSGGAVGERLESCEHLVEQCTGWLGRAEAYGAGPGADLAFGEVCPADEQLEEVEVETGE
jgi:hypothetical protein